MTKYDFIYFDIETVGKYYNVDDIKESDILLYNLLNKKYQKSEEFPELSFNDYYLKYCSLMPEYGKIVCVSIGYMTKNDVWKVDGIIGTEEEILNQTANIFNKALERNLMPCGYNIINFDLPWLNKKMIKYGIRVPYNILLFDKKPWNLKVLDLCDAWKMTTKYMTSLEVVTYELGLESPKTDMHGGEVHDVYWVENDINKISKYCNGDVKALVDIVEKFSESYGNI